MIRLFRICMHEANTRIYSSEIPLNYICVCCSKKEDKYWIKGRKENNWHTQIMRRVKCFLPAGWLFSLRYFYFICCYTRSMYNQLSLAAFSEFLRNFFALTEEKHLNFRTHSIFSHFDLLIAIFNVKSR